MAITPHIEPPTPEQFYNEEVGPQVFEETEPWRWGTVYHTTCHRESDNTYWRVSHRASEQEGWEELGRGECTIEQVYPHQETRTIYTNKP